MDQRLMGEIDALLQRAASGECGYSNREVINALERCQKAVAAHRVLTRYYPRVSANTTPSVLYATVKASMAELSLSEPWKALSRTARHVLGDDSRQVATETTTSCSDTESATKPESPVLSKAKPLRNSSSSLQEESSGVSKSAAAQRSAMSSTNPPAVATITEVVLPPPVGWSDVVIAESAAALLHGILSVYGIGSGEVVLVPRLLFHPYHRLVSVLHRRGVVAVGYEIDYANMCADMAGLVACFKSRQGGALREVGRGATSGGGIRAILLFSIGGRAPQNLDEVVREARRHGCLSVTIQPPNFSCRSMALFEDHDDSVADMQPLGRPLKTLFQEDVHVVSFDGAGLFGGAVGVAADARMTQVLASHVVHHASPCAPSRHWARLLRYVLHVLASDGVTLAWARNACELLGFIVWGMHLAVEAAAALTALGRRVTQDAVASALRYVLLRYGEGGERAAVAPGPRCTAAAAPCIPGGATEAAHPTPQRSAELSQLSWLRKALAGFDEECARFGDVGKAVTNALSLRDSDENVAAGDGTAQLWPLATFLDLPLLRAVAGQATALYQQCAPLFSMTSTAAPANGPLTDNSKPTKMTSPFPAPHVGQRTWLREFARVQAAEADRTCAALWDFLRQLPSYIEVVSAGEPDRPEACVESGGSGVLLRVQCPVLCVRALRTCGVDATVFTPRAALGTPLERANHFDDCILIDAPEGSESELLARQAIFFPMHRSMRQESRAVVLHCLSSALPRQVVESPCKAFHRQVQRRSDVKHAYRSAEVDALVQQAPPGGICEERSPLLLSLLVGPLPAYLLSKL